MITRETLTSNEVLSSLTDEQITAITTLSKNDEDATIGARIGEIYREFDRKIESLTGVKRAGDEKTYHYFERAIRETQGGIDDFKSQIETLKTENARLGEAIAKGSDGEAQKAIEQARADLANVQKQYADLQKQVAKDKERHAAELLGIRVENELAASRATLKFKAGIPDAAVTSLINAACDRIKGMKPTIFKTENGSEVLAFLGENGEPLRNAEDRLNLYTAADLLKRELRAVGILDEGRRQGGAGSQPIDSSISKGYIDVSGARTKTEALSIIERDLLKAGLAKGSDEYQARLDEAWKNPIIEQLPMN